MIRIEKTEVVGFEHAIRGMRNPKNSWDKSDSIWCCPGDALCDCVPYCKEWHYEIGPNDLKLMMTLRNAGTDHRKFMRMIVVYCDITAPFYWWKEFDTYKVGTVADSCSTMHKIHAKEFTLEDFSCERMTHVCKDVILTEVIHELNYQRQAFNDTKDKRYFENMIQLLPTSYNQKRTVMLNYEVLANMYKSRKNHKLDEWHELCHWVETLPYSQLITGKEGEECG